MHVGATKENAKAAADKKRKANKLEEKAKMGANLIATEEKAKAEEYGNSKNSNNLAEIAELMR